MVQYMETVSLESITVYIFAPVGKMWHYVVNDLQHNRISEGYAPSRNDCLFLAEIGLS